MEVFLIKVCICKPQLVCGATHWRLIVSSNTHRKTIPTTQINWSKSCFTSISKRERTSASFQLWTTFTRKWVFLMSLKCWNRTKWNAYLIYNYSDYDCYMTRKSCLMINMEKDNWISRILLFAVSRQLHSSTLCFWCIGAFPFSLSMTNMPLKELRTWIRLSRFSKQLIWSCKCDSSPSMTIECSIPEYCNVF